MKDNVRSIPHFWLLLAMLTLVVTNRMAQANYMFPEIEKVPTERLIANLERRLVTNIVENAFIQPGEELKLWSYNRRPQDGTYLVDSNGCINLPEMGPTKVAGLSIDQAIRKLNGGKEAHEPGAPGMRLEQTWQQRRGRLLPGEAAQLHYELARVHSIAYAQGPAEFQALKGGDRPFLGFGADAGLPPDRRRMRSGGPLDHPLHERAYATPHLDAAIDQYRAALKLNTNHLASQLGLGWCQEQKGMTNDAIEAYRKAMALAWDKEKGHDSILETSWVEEIAAYLLPLLNSQKDSAEIARIKSYTLAIQNKGRAITPLLVPLAADLALPDLIDPEAAVPFDLDGSGLPRRWQWITPKAAWLVYDPSRKGQITSGLQLFGNVTFWVFWNNGYQPLSSLDNNGDGQLTGAELEGLALWQDRNGNGISDPGEVQPLDSLGISALSCSCVPHTTGISFNPEGVLFKDGTRRPTFDWIARQKVTLP
jgi:tetratricopeptide (TPR) repeat protein